MKQRTIVATLLENRKCFGMSATNSPKMNASWYLLLFSRRPHGSCTCEAYPSNLGSVAELIHGLKLGSTEVGDVLTARNDEVGHLSQRKALSKFHKLSFCHCSRVVVELDPLLAIVVLTKYTGVFDSFVLRLDQMSNVRKISCVEKSVAILQFPKFVGSVHGC